MSNRDRAGQHAVHGGRRVLRWIARIALGLVGLVAIAIVGAIVFMHTAYGRETLRSQVEKQLAKTFTGGATVGKLEGDPLGELVLRDLVINGPDRKPALTFGTLRVRITLLDLLRHDIRVTEVIGDDVDIAVKRDASGAFELAQLMKPSSAPAPDPAVPAKKSPWNVELPAIAIHRAHVMVDTGNADAQIVNLDGLAIDASAKLLASGTTSARLALRATWRERGVPITIVGSLSDNGELAAVPLFDVRVGDVAVSATDVRVARRGGRAPGIAGMVTVHASRAAVMHLVPRVQLPADVALSVRAVEGAATGTPITLVGALGTTPVFAQLTADLDAPRVVGMLATGDVDLATLTAGKLAATAGAMFTFDARPGAAGQLPIGKLTISGHGTYQNLPRAELTALATSDGTHVATTLDVTGAAHATLTAELRRVAETITLEHATLIASTRDPARASGGKAPVHGELDLALTAHGALQPTPDLAIAGKIVGSHLSMQDMSVRTLEVGIDARSLPAHPAGSAHVKLTDIVRGDMALGALAVDASSRSDGKIAVNVTSHPEQNPWLVELAALVTPPTPANASTLTVALQHHHIRAGNGGDWTGSSGTIVVAPAQFAIRDLRSASHDGTIAIAGSFTRTGKHAGDLAANVDVHSMMLDVLRKGYLGTANAHVAVTRRGGAWAGDIAVGGKAFALHAGMPLIEGDVKITARPEQVTIAANVSNTKLGAMKLALDLAPPAKLEDIAAWKARGRNAIRTAQLTLSGVDLEKLIAMLPIGKTIDTTLPRATIATVSSVAPNADLRPPSTTPPRPMLTGKLDADLQMTATTASGAIHVRDARSPSLRGVRSADVDLVLAQTAADELTPTLTIKLADVGSVVARAQLTLPARSLDPAAWRKLGVAALRGASIQTDDIAIDPALLARFQIASTMRGHARAEVDVADGLKSVTVKATVTGLRGNPLAQPVDIQLGATIDAKTATASLGMQTQGKALTLLKVNGQVPLSLTALRAGSVNFAALPLTATVELPQTSAPQLLNALGRTEITGGTLDGKVTIGGTVGKPTVVARVTGVGLAVPPGVGGKPIKSIKQIVVDAAWTGERGKLTLTGTEDAGGSLSVVAEAAPGALAAGTAKITATHFDLTPLLAFAPGPAGGASGTLDASLTVNGFDPRTAHVLGELHLKGARVPLAPTLGTLRNANIDIAIRAHDITIATTGKLGAGDVKIAGSIGLDGVAISGGKATITLRKVSPLGAVQPQIDADVTATIARKGAQWIADVVVDHGFVKITKLGGEALKPIGTPVDVTIAHGKPMPKPTKTRVNSENAMTTAATTHDGPNADAAPKQPALAVNLVLHATKIESDEFRTTIAGKLAITADADALGVVGSIAAQSGDLDLFDRRYRVERAAVQFDGTVDPLLDVRIVYDFTDVTTITEVHGRLSKPELELSADPATYTQSQLLGFLLGGEPGGDPTSGSARDKATDAGASFIANQIGGYVRKALPIDVDVIRYEAASATSSAAVTVGSWITHTLFFSVKDHLDARPDENSDEGTLEYWLTHRTELEGTIGDRGYDGVDLLWRKRF